MTPQPLHFAAAGAWCFGWYHAPRVPARDLVVVLCRPMGYEAMCSWRVYAQLAQALAEAGLPVLRFDYHGTGDSAGDDHEPDRMEAWLASIEAAVAQARARSGASQVALVGVRLGATLAATAAARLGGVDSLVMWAPCPGGKQFARELRAFGLPQSEGSLRALGYHYSAQTLQQLQTLDLSRLEQRPAARALVIARDDLPQEGPVPAVLRKLGVDCHHEVWPGYAAMMQDPSEGVREVPALQPLVDWLLQSPAAQAQADAPAASLPEAPVPEVGSVREEAVQFGAGLVGVIAAPVAGEDRRRGATAVILLNVGGNSRIGPHRNYVTAARAFAAQGYTVLRMDVAGIGDSPNPPGQPHASLYCKDATGDVRAAIDAMWARGCREFVLLGVCSGSFLAFQTALADPRVGMQVLLNSRLLEWNPQRQGDTWQNSMQRYTKSTDYYLQALRDPRAWWRLAGRFVRGEIHVGAIARRFVEVVGARMRRALGRLVGTPQDESLLQRMRGVCQRGTSTLMLISEADDGRDYVEFHFGRLGRRMRRQDNFRMELVPDADHTFSDEESFRRVMDSVLRHLEARPAAPAVPEPQGVRAARLEAAGPVG